LAIRCDQFAADPLSAFDLHDLEKRAAAYRLQRMIETDRAQKIFEN
jgi:hypothetical protein